MEEGRWDAWVGRSQIAEDPMRLWPAQALSATLGKSTPPACRPGDPLPFVWSWMYFLEPAKKQDIGPDGHPKRGGFLPPIAHPRRMWAGSRCAFHAPLLAETPARKTSIIKSVEEKAGKAGPMVFVTIAHEIASGGVTAMTEEQDIVYMDIPDSFQPPAKTPLPDCAHSETVDIDPVLLFRFSALTFNGHRIHYDRSYAMETENYPGLVAHGPLQAVLLYDFGVRLHSNRPPDSFRFRGVSPLFDFDKPSLHARETEGGALELFMAKDDGAVSMKATMEWRG